MRRHFVLAGLPDTPYDGGIYYGHLSVPTVYPFAPPSICIVTPNGRFKVLPVVPA